MPPNDNQAEASPQSAADIDERFSKVLDRLEPPANAAPAEAAREESREDESLVSVMAQGREHLMQRMRDHAAQAEAKKNAYKPPPMTDRQRAALEAEQNAGKRARERHEAELASRPPPPAREPWDGSNTPVHRPGAAVPDPTSLSPTGFVAGSGRLDTEGKHKVVMPQ